MGEFAPRLIFHHRGGGVIAQPVERSGEQHTAFDRARAVFRVGLERSLRTIELSLLEAPSAQHQKHLARPKIGVRRSPSVSSGAVAKCEASVTALVVCLRLLATAPTPRYAKGLAPMRLPTLPQGLASWSACGTCRKRQAASHALSTHAVARSNFVFLAGLKDERSPQWCIGCHAPVRGESDGVGCAACHAGERGVLSVEASPESPHAIVVSKALHDGTVCSGCHEFGFLEYDRDGGISGLSKHHSQQSTVTEWRAP